MKGVAKDEDGFCWVHIVVAVGDVRAGASSLITSVTGHIQYNIRHYRHCNERIIDLTNPCILIEPRIARTIGNSTGCV